MGVLKFNYQCQMDGKTGSFQCDRPVIEITISSGGKQFVTHGLIDSGCTTTVADSSIADFLNIDLSTCLEISIGGICGEGKGHLHEVDYYVAGGGDNFSGPIIFVKDLPFSILLGQNNFFDKFEVIFKRSKGFYTIKRVQ